MKKLSVIILAILVLVLAFPLPVFAENTSFSGGVGTTDDPYLISTANEFALIGDSKDSNLYYKLVDDIDLSKYSAGSSFPMIAEFNGVLDGDGHKIINANVTNSLYASLFNVIRGTVKNLGIGSGNFSITRSYKNSDNPTDHTGTLRATCYAASFAQYNYGTIENCYNKASVKAYSTTNAELDMNSCISNAYAAGIVVYNMGTIRNCYNAGTISASSSATVYSTVTETAISYGAGIAYTLDAQGTIQNCYTTNLPSVSSYVDKNRGRPKSETYCDAIVNVKNGELSNCYYISANGTSANGIKLTADDALDSSKYTGFDFENTWIVDPCSDYKYPQLRLNRQANANPLLHKYVMGMCVLCGDCLDDTIVIKPYENAISSVLNEFDGQTVVITNSNGDILSSNDLLGTGSKISLYSGENVLGEVTVVVLGDFNGDGIVDNKDVVLSMQRVVELIESNEYQSIAIDVTGDGKINNQDCTRLAQYLVGKYSL